MPNSYLKATQTIASLTLAANPGSINVVTTAWTNSASTSDWTVDGSGGVVYSGSTSGKAIPFQLNMKWDTSGGHTYSFYILKGSTKYVVATINVDPVVTTAKSLAGNSSTPIVCEPGDIFYVGTRRTGVGTADTATNVVLTFNIASSN